MEKHEYFLTLRNLKSEDPQPLAKLLNHIEETLDVCIEHSNFEVVHKGKRKFHNVHLHAYIWAVKNIYFKQNIQVPKGIHMNVQRARSKKAIQLYISKSQKLDTCSDVRNHIYYLDYKDENEPSDDEELIKPESIEDEILPQKLPKLVNL